MQILDDSANNYPSAIKARSVRIAVTQQTGSGAIVQDLVFALLNAKKNFHVVIVGHANLHTHVSLWICLICWFHQRQERCSKMCYYCGFYPPYHYLLPYQYSATPLTYPQYGYTFPLYPAPYPVGYTFMPPVSPVPYILPDFPRGEHRVGNCYCICQ